MALAAGPGKRRYGRARTWERGRIVLLAALVAAAAAVFYVSVTYPLENEPVTGGVLWRASVYGFVMGLMVGAFHQFYVDRPAGRWIRRLPFAPRLFINIVAGSVMIVLGFIICDLMFYRVIAYDLDRWINAIAFLLVVFSLAFFIVEMRQFIGARTLTNLVLGRYERPVPEQRIFLFLDLANSTRLAQKLGDIGVQALIKRVFFDIDGIITDHGGEVHRYIGDEVVITWPLEEGIRGARCLQCVFAIFDHIVAESDAYTSRFGVVPVFRAGIHGGQVISSQCGDSKREIVYFGDTVNSAARIQAECKVLNVPMLISGELLQMIDVPAEFSVVRRASVLLRGRDEPTRLFTLARAERAAA